MKIGDLIAILGLFSPEDEVIMTTTGVGYEKPSNLAIKPASDLGKEVVVINPGQGTIFIPSWWQDHEHVQQYCEIAGLEGLKQYLAI